MARKRKTTDSCLTGFLEKHQSDRHCQKVTNCRYWRRRRTNPTYLVATQSPPCIMHGCANDIKWQGLPYHKQSINLCREKGKAPLVLPLTPCSALPTSSMSPFNKSLPSHLRSCSLDVAATQEHPQLHLKRRTHKPSTNQWFAFGKNPTLCLAVWISLVDEMPKKGKKRNEKVLWLWIYHDQWHEADDALCFSSHSWFRILRTKGSNELAPKVNCRSLLILNVWKCRQGSSSPISTAGNQLSRQVQMDYHHRRDSLGLASLLVLIGFSPQGHRTIYFHGY